MRLEIPVAMLRNLRGMVRRHRRDMIGSRRRLARFSVIAVGQLVVVTATALRAADGGPETD